MKKQLVANLIAGLTCALPLMFWLGSAVVALTILRKGYAEGFTIFLVALIPSVMWAMNGQPVAAVCLLLVSATASTLRYSVSWPVTLLIMVPVSFILFFFLGSYLDSQIQHVMELVMEAYGENTRKLLWNAEIISEKDVIVQLRSSILKTFSFVMVSTSIISLLLARSWQSKLYNIGKFQEEMHALILSPIQVVCLLVGGGVAMMYPENLYANMILPALLMPLLLSGIGLMHGVVKQKKAGNLWLVLFYILLIVAYPLVVVLASVDSIVDIRERIRKNNLSTHQ